MLLQVANVVLVHLDDRGVLWTPLLQQLLNPAPVVRESTFDLSLG